ncbi:hypothetical protein GW17_00017461 [Ensete ventricosum]|nr:hypothetical protein GW17_00017461 [Ensete ventricosum]
MNRILELGFGKAVEDILDFLGSRQADHVCKQYMNTQSAKFSRQNLLLSATLNDKVNHLANISLENPVMIGMDCKKDSAVPLKLSLGDAVSSASVVGGDLEGVGALSIQPTENYNLPSQLVQRYVKGKFILQIVVFFSTCDAVDFHYSLLNKFKWSHNLQPEANQEQKFVSCRSFHLHGNMEHEDRRKAFHEFTSEKSALLLCTDVAARGLDFPKVRSIIQYDSPGEASEYVHRYHPTSFVACSKRKTVMLYLADSYFVTLALLGSEEQQGWVRKAKLCYSFNQSRLIICMICSIMVSS